MTNTELIEIIRKFEASGWSLLEVASKKWLSDNNSADAAAELKKTLEEADEQCGKCGCEFDPLYKRALELLK